MNLTEDLVLEVQDGTKTFQIMVHKKVYTEGRVKRLCE